MPKAPSFMSTPACTIDTEVGADMCPSGDHVCSGQRPASTPQPTAKKGKMIFWNSGLRAPLRPASHSAGRSNVPSPASCTTAKTPIQMPTEPPTSISVSFIAPYSLRVEPQMPMSR